MKRIPLKALLASSAAAIILATLIAILWRGGVLASAQAALAPPGAERPLVPLHGLFVVTFIFLAAILTAAAVALWGGRRALPFIGGGIALLGVLNLVLSRLVETDIAYAPIALAAIGGTCVAQIYRLWGIDARLTAYVDQIVKRVYARPAAETKSPGLMSGLKLLETVLPLHEAIVLHAGEKGGLDLAARLQPTNISPIEPSRNSAWREGVMLCERAITTGELVVAASPTAAVAATPSNNGAGQPGDATNGTSVALPLRHEGQMMGALLVRLRENFAEEDRPLLTAVGAQLAQDLHRDQTRAKAAQTSKHFQPIFSAESAERRLMALGVVSDLLRKERLIVNLLEEMPDAHAVASLDGTIIYANANLRQAAELNDAETPTIDLFGLLDRFRSGVFDEPSIAVRRVLQSGEPYERELFFQERNQTLKLRIALVSEPADAPTGATTGAVHAARRSPRPLCLVVSVSDVTKQKEFVSLKSDMVSLMSHELRTPITSINGFAELLVIDEALSEEQREFLMIIRSESQRLSRMLDTFLAVSKLESGEQQSVVKAPLLLNELVQEMVTSFQPLAKKKRIRMVVQTVPSLPPVAADRDLITQAISNLIDNAIKYSPERTTVTVSTALETDAVRVAIEDRGYGIPSEAIDRVWEKFYRVARDTQQERDDESTGLGLAFVREVIEQHGGQVSLDSENGRGSTFSFTLPRL